MQVILLEKVKKLGNLGDKVTVKSGFGRNYLIPQAKAVFATEKNIEVFEQRRAEFEIKAQFDLSVAEKRAAIINDLVLVLEVQANEEGKMYGSIGVSEIYDAIKKLSVEMNKREIVLPEGPFQLLGQYKVEVHLHSDVIAHFQLEIKASK